MPGEAKTPGWLMSSGVRRFFGVAAGAMATARRRRTARIWQIRLMRLSSETISLRVSARKVAPRPALSHPPHQQHRVQPAEGKRVGHGHADGHLTRLVGYVVEIALRIGPGVVGGGRNHAAVDSEHGGQE